MVSFEMAKLLQFGFLLLLTFFCVSVPSTNAAPIKSVTGCGWKRSLMATGVNIVSDYIFSDRNEIAVSVRCKQTCTEIEVEMNNGRPNSLTVCNENGTPCVRGTLHRCSSALISFPSFEIPIGDLRVKVTLQTNLYDCFSVDLDQCITKA